MPRVRLEDTKDWQLADRSHDVRGRELRDSVGRALGTIKTMIVDTDARRVESVVLENDSEYPVRDLQIMEQAVYFIPSVPGAVASEAAPEPAAEGPPASQAADEIEESEEPETVESAPEAPTWSAPDETPSATSAWTPPAESGGWSPPAAEPAPMPPAMEAEVDPGPATTEWSQPAYVAPSFVAPPPPPPYTAPDLAAADPSPSLDPSVAPPAAPAEESYPGVPPPAPPAEEGSYDPLADPFAAPPASPPAEPFTAPYAEPVGQNDYVPPAPANEWTPAPDAPPSADWNEGPDPSSAEPPGAWSAPTEAPPPPPPAADAWSAPADVEPRQDEGFTEAGLAAGGLATGGFAMPPELPREEPASDVVDPDDRPVEPLVPGGSPVVAPAEPGHAPGAYGGVAPEPGFPTHAAPPEAAAGHTLHGTGSEQGFAPPPGPDADERFRAHFAERYTDSGASFDDLRAAYGFGEEAANIPELRWAGDDTLRRRFNERFGYPENDRLAWLGARDAVKRGMGK